MSATQVRDYIVRDFMRKGVLTIDPGSTVREAVKIMVDNDVACVVVIGDGKLQGMFTEEDLLRMLARGETPERVLVKDAMSPTIRSVTPDQSSQEAARTMIERKGRLLVLESGRVTGIVTTSDIVKVIYRTGRSFDISKVVSKNVEMVDAYAPLKDVIQRMESRKIGSAVVTKGGIPYGIFTERDLLNKVLFLGTELETPVGQVSTFPLVMVHSGVDGREVAGGMVSRYVKRFPLTQDGKIVGIITARDLVKAYASLPREIEDQDLAREARVRYGELCPLCNTRIDSTGLCGCGAGGA